MTHIKSVTRAVGHCYACRRMVWPSDLVFFGPVAHLKCAVCGPWTRAQWLEARGAVPLEPVPELPSTRPTAKATREHRRRDLLGMGYARVTRKVWFDITTDPAYGA